MSLDVAQRQHLMRLRERANASPLDTQERFGATETADAVQTVQETPHVFTSPNRTYTVLETLKSGAEDHETISYKVTDSDGKLYSLKVKSVGYGKAGEYLDLRRRAYELTDALNGIDNPHIVRNTEVFELSARDIVIVREWVEGKSLDQIVRETRYDETRAIAFAHDMEEQLTALHEAEAPIVHRDVKPNNIIVRDDGSIALIDYGIAKLLKVDNEDTPTTFSKPGTPGYQAPEVERLSNATPAFDVYGLGQTIIHTLCGKHPIDPREGDRAKRTEETINTLHVSQEFKQALRTATAEDPARRYKTVREFVDALPETTSQAATPVTALTTLDNLYGIDPEVARLLSERLSKYEMPDNLKKEIQAITLIFENEYKGFIPELHPLDADFLKRLARTLRALGYEHDPDQEHKLTENTGDKRIEEMARKMDDKQMRFIRRRKESSLTDSLIVGSYDYDGTYMDYALQDEEGNTVKRNELDSTKGKKIIVTPAEAVTIFNNKDYLRMKFREGLWSICTYAGIAATVVSSYGLVRAEIDPAISAAPSLIAVAIGSVIYAAGSMYMRNKCEDSAKKIAAAHLQDDSEEITADDASALELALTPAKGYRYELFEEETTSPRITARAMDDTDTAPGTTRSVNFDEYTGPMPKTEFLKSYTTSRREYLGENEHHKPTRRGKRGGIR